MVAMNDDIMAEILNRTKLGWKAFGKMSTIFKSKMPICSKRKVFNQCLLPVLTYRCETELPPGRPARPSENMKFKSELIRLHYIEVE